MDAPTVSNNFLATTPKKEEFVLPKKEDPDNATCDIDLESMIESFEDSYGLPVYSCTHCQLKNTKKIRILKHLRLLGKGKDLECDKCGRKFSEIRYLKYHTERVHDKKVNFECFVCQRGYRDKASLRSHLNIHDEAKTPPKVFKETYLPQELLEQLKTSEKVMFEEKELPKDLVCQFCAKIFMSANSAVRHEKLHQDEEKHNRIMENLEFEAIHKDDSKTAVKEEKVKLETSKEDVKMRLKENMFKLERGALPPKITHKLTNQQEDEKMFLFKCKACQHQFKSSKLLRTHDCKNMEQPDNTKSFLFRCQTCSTQFDSSKLLRSHVCAESSTNVSIDKNLVKKSMKAPDKNSEDIFQEERNVIIAPSTTHHDSTQDELEQSEVGDPHKVVRLIDPAPLQTNVIQGLGKLENTTPIKRKWENPPTIDDLVQVEAKKSIHLQKIEPHGQCPTGT